jgi:hypothetical protein
MGVSPPDTVNQFPQLTGYYLVQVIILALALGADSLDGPNGSERHRQLAPPVLGVLAIGVSLVVVVVLGLLRLRSRSAAPGVLRRQREAAGHLG